MDILNFFCFNKRKVDFSAQFGPDCLEYTPDARTCQKHGPIKFIREDFGGCKECTQKWRTVLFPQKIVKS